MNISCYKCEKTPKYSETQAERAKNWPTYYIDRCLILDDEKYFTYDGSNMQGNDSYYTNDKSKCPDSVRFSGKDKVMVWVAISNRGISKPLFRPSKSETVHSDIYIY